MASMKWIKFPDKRLVLNGLAWFDENSPKLWRLPKRLKKVVRPPIWELAEMPSGGRIRFTSDTTSLAIRVSYPSIGSTHNMCGIGKMGIACYIDGNFWKPVLPEKTGKSELAFFTGFTKKRREFVLYLPLYNPVDILAVGFDKSARISRPRSFIRSKPVVFYGTSITQGGCASQAGLSYEAIIGRKLNIDFVNLGFSGEGRGEPEMAAALAEIDASCFVLDYAQNSPTADELRERYDPFIQTIRAAHPETPIVCIAPIFATRNLHLKDQLRRFNDLSEVIRYAAMMRVLDGDRNMYLVEGLGLLSADDADGFVDGVHPNDLGFERMAKSLAPILVDVMELPRVRIGSKMRGTM